VRTGWLDASDELGLFDLIIGSDLLYETEHIGLLSAFINRHAQPTCEVIIVDPGRGQRAQFTKKMAALGFACQQLARTVPDDGTIGQSNRYSRVAPVAA